MGFRSQSYVVRAALVAIPSLGLHIPAPPAVVTWPVYTGFLPEKEPDNAVAVYNTAGVVLGAFQRTGEVQESKGVQIRVRAKNWELADTKLSEIMEVIDGFKGAVVVVDLVHYVVTALYRTTCGLDLGEEQTGGRRILATNAMVAYKRELIGPGA